jgi:topoisomerase IV subunit A
VQDIGPKDEMVAVAVNDGTSVIVSGTGRGGKATEFKVGAKDMAAYRGARARKGQPLPTKLKPTGLA